MTAAPDLVRFSLPATTPALGPLRAKGALPPPVEAHAPIEITHFGSGIWSYTRRIAGAIFLDSRPATIIRSDCRGDPRKTSAPKRATS